MNQSYLEYSQIAIAKGAIEGIGQGRFIPQPLSIAPFQTPTQFYSHLSNLQILWQKYLSRVEKHTQTIEHIFTLSEKDPYISFLYQIYQQTKSTTLDKKNYLTFLRCDYLMDGDEREPKLIEYNNMQMGLFNISELITGAFVEWKAEGQEGYFQNRTTEFFAGVVGEQYRMRHLKGIFVIMVSSCEILTIVEQKNLEFLLKKQGIKTKRLKYRDLLDKGRIDQHNNLIVDGELVSFAYFRSGFLIKQYKEVGTPEDALKARILLAGSNTTCIPSIRMQVLNTKIAQSYLSKPEIVGKFLEKEEITTLMRCIIEDYNICKMGNEELGEIIKMAKKDPMGWVLKPNMDGGRNNIYGQAVIETLQNLKNLEVRDYVLMRLVKNCPIYPNGTIVRGYRFFPIRCTYQFSRFGAISQVSGNVITNSASGYVIKTREQGKNESDHYWGCDAYATWKKGQFLDGNNLEIDKDGKYVEKPKGDNKLSEADEGKINTQQSNIEQKDISIQQKEENWSFLPSKICRTKSQLDFIKQNIKNAKSFKLLYRGSENDFSAQKFHQKCDNISNTLTIILTEFGKKIGAFTHYQWNDKKKDGHGWVNDQQMNAFLLSISLRQKMVPNDDQYLILCNPNFGPCFGSGNSDLHISDHCNTNSSSYSYFPLCYNLENGDRYINNQQSWTAFSGAPKGYHFRVVEYEVFETIY